MEKVHRNYELYKYYITMFILHVNQYYESKRMGLDKERQSLSFNMRKQSNEKLFHKLVTNNHGNMD